jgi:hypothetical protein
VTRYRIAIDGRLTARLASGLDGVELESGETGSALLAEVASAAELDGLLQRLGDLGIDVVSLEQRPAGA